MILNLWTRLDLWVGQHQLVAVAIAVLVLVAFFWLLSISGGDCIRSVSGDAPRIPGESPEFGLSTWLHERSRGEKSRVFAVSRPGFEPGTKGLKVPCSTVELAAREVPQV